MDGLAPVSRRCRSHGYLGDPMNDLLLSWEGHRPDSSYRWLGADVAALPLPRSSRGRMMLVLDHRNRDTRGGNPCLRGGDGARAPLKVSFPARVQV